MMAWWCRKFVVQKRPCPHWASFRLPPKGCYPQDKPSSWKKLPENLVLYRCSVKHHFCMIVKSAKSFALHHFKHGSKTSQNITDPLPNVGVATGTKHTTKTPLPCNLLWSLFRWALAEKKRDKQKKGFVGIGIFVIGPITWIHMKTILYTYHTESYMQKLPLIHFEWPKAQTRATGRMSRSSAALGCASKRIGPWFFQRTWGFQGFIWIHIIKSSPRDSLDSLPDSTKSTKLYQLCLGKISNKKKLFKGWGHSKFATNKKSQIINSIIHWDDLPPSNSGKCRFVYRDARIPY